MSQSVKGNLVRETGESTFRIETVPDNYDFGVLMLLNVRGNI